jgi:hypothetical protein
MLVIRIKVCLYLLVINENVILIKYNYERIITGRMERAGPEG